MKNLIKNRIEKINFANNKKGRIIYWMSRDQRVSDNWALIAAQDYALENNEKFEIIFCLVDNFYGSTQRQFGFMLEGLKQTAENLAGLNIPFKLLKGDPSEKIPEFVNNNETGAVFCDFDPLRIKKAWQKSVSAKIHCPMYCVDAHNIIPATVVSNKAEFAAYTIRPKIHKLLGEYLTEMPVPVFHKANEEIDRSVNMIEFNLSKFESNPGQTRFKPGEKAALKTLNDFIAEKLETYHSDRNNPLLDGQSDLSPYLHFGMISAQHCAYEVMMLPQNESTNAFLEELIVRRELSENHVFFNENYDNFMGIHPWAAETLNMHRSDKREHIYSAEEFEFARTHDPYWNAAQMEMIKLGKMHGYMRMYWAKKILEWCISPETAIETAVYLNDKYELDGRDPNGYAGILWSIGGLHDRAWEERQVFGKIRYMNSGGLKRKFNADSYVKKINDISGTMF